MLRRQLRPYVFIIFVVVVLTFTQVIADLALPNYLAHIVNIGIAQHDLSYILRMGAVMLVISLWGVASAVLAGFLSSKIALGVGKRLRNLLFSKVTAFSLAEFDEISTASMITRTTNDVQQIQTTLFMFLRMMLRAPLMCVGGIIMAVKKDSHLSLVLLGILPVVIAVLFLVMRKAIPLFRQLQTRIDKINLVLRENLIGIRIVRAFGRIGHEKRRFAQANHELTQTGLDINRLMALLNPTMMFTMNFLSVIIVWIASYRINGGDLQIGDMLAFIQYAMIIFMSFMMFSFMFVLLPRAFSSYERIKEVVSTRQEIIDPVRPARIPLLQGDLSFEGVTFRYKGAERPAVKDISFSASPGEVIAIVGGTGAGKTTLANLLMRFYDVECGSIKIDGIDIRDMKQHDLRQRIGYVPQKSVLFSGSIAENIRYGKPDASLDDIVHACKVAQATEFIDQLPEKYESQLSQGGTNISGGQKQRLSIARALVRKPQIYLFDDSFSALDYSTDAALQKSLKDEIKDSVVLIIAQRVASVLGANKILVMDNGELKGSGTHKELFASNEIYREIVLSQLSETEIG